MSHQPRKQAVGANRELKIALTKDQYEYVRRCIHGQSRFDVRFELDRDAGFEDDGVLIIHFREYFPSMSEWRKENP